MDLAKISLNAIREKKVAILGYGNQGRAHALNLRDSGVLVRVGCASPSSQKRANEDGFEGASYLDAVKESDIAMLLVADQCMPAVFESILPSLKLNRKIIGFAHGYAVHFRTIQIPENIPYFLAAPKGAGAILRANFQKGGGLPGAFAVGSDPSDEFKALVLSYAKAIGIATSFLIESSFQEETEGDLFGEQAVLCGGLMQLMENAFEILVSNGAQPETAFLDCCFEAKMILELWIQYGPYEFSKMISPTAFYGGLSRGRRIIDSRVRAEMEKIFDELRNGEFKSEWAKEVAAGMPTLEPERQRLRDSPLQNAFERYLLTCGP